MLKNIKDFPIVSNVCEQVLREIEEQKEWSMAHVIMNPLASSLLHLHSKMTEIYVVTGGYGELILGTPKTHFISYPVVAGSVFKILTDIPHMLQNKSGSHLEHLVFAFPPFDPLDVKILKEQPLIRKTQRLILPETQDCFDGAKILPYAFPDLNISITFGWVTNGATKRKRPHYHKISTEWIYVVEGSGYIKINEYHLTIKQGDWIRVNPRIKHCLKNEEAEDLVVVCTCFPAFQMEDVYY